MNRAFPIGAALTVALDALGPPHANHGLFCELRDLYEIIAWLVGDIPTVEQLPAHTAAARTVLLAEHPQLTGATEPPPSGAPDTEVLAWLATQEALFGANITITRGVAS